MALMNGMVELRPSVLPDSVINSETDMSMLMSRTARWLWIGVAVLLIAIFAAGGWFLYAQNAEYEYNGGTYEPERVAPDFTMTDQFGQPFSLSEQRGKVVLVFFGYTFCPDFCPTTMAEVQQTIDNLGDEAENVEVAFVSVDPDRDTPERLKEYMDFFNPEFYGLSASDEATDQIKQDWGVLGEKLDPEEGSDYYLVNHTTSLFAVDRDGYLRVVWPYGTGTDAITDDVRHMLES